ncbi:unnamed protein product, partial [Staurois parvus]
SLLWPVTGPKPVFGATVWRVEAAAMGGHTATYDKMETSRSVRGDLKVGTWQSGSNGGGTGTQVTTVGPAAA